MNDSWNPTIADYESVQIIELPPSFIPPCEVNNLLPPGSVRRPHVYDSLFLNALGTTNDQDDPRAEPSECDASPSRAWMLLECLIQIPRLILTVLRITRSLVADSKPRVT